MRLLLDTNALIYLLRAPEQMRAEARAALADPENDVAFSPVNIWEIEIKAKARKLVMPAEDTLVATRALRIRELLVSSDHAVVAGRLPLHHLDPFDRMLVAQALVEDLTLVTRDHVFAAYGIPVLPC